ncbi:hypothetical protein [Roseovarius sp. ZX-A-9]|uniref:hypothetical protein n=1 Tax=Roseovarius sp. ZX-A-9 TaxID=3014783 RepID=UPI003FA684B6
MPQSAAGFFEELLADKEGHTGFLEIRLGLLEKLGEEKYAQLNAPKMDEVE